MSSHPIPPTTFRVRTGYRLAAGLAVALAAGSSDGWAAEKDGRAKPATPPGIEQQCETEITAQTERLHADYTRELAVLARAFQEKADLDNLLLVKAEQNRFNKEKSLSEKNVASGPTELRQFQARYLSLLKSSKEHIAWRYYTAADDLKKKYTREGEIQKALSYKADADRLTAKHPFLTEAARSDKPAETAAKIKPEAPPIKPIASDTVVKVEDLYADYLKDVSAANQKYKNQKFTVMGEIMSFHPGSGSKDFKISLKVHGTAWRVECLCNYRGEGMIVIADDVVSADVFEKKASYILGPATYSSKSERKRTSLIWTGETRGFTGQCQGAIGGKILFEDCIWSDKK